ncbi:MAG: amine oxidase [Saprospiraceae bacterium]
MNPFRSFIMGGFECADHINRSGERVNLLRETGHDERADEDFRRLAELGILVAREGICWSAVETAPFVFDWTEVRNRLLAARRHGVQVIWDMCHFGYPADLYPTHPQFDARFVALCREFALFHQTNSTETLLVIPINEMSFLSWHSGDVRGAPPFAIHCGWDLKYHLCRAAIRGLEIIKELVPSARVMLVEPLVKVHPGPEETDHDAVRGMDEAQFQAMDIVTGRMCPELGGREDYLDLPGFNYYYNGQWVHGGEYLPWPATEPGRTPLVDLLEGVCQRYGKPVWLSETGHFGDNRALWIDEIADTCREAARRNIPLRGVCIYPVIDRPDWDDLTSWSNCGLWDMDEQGNRIAHEESLAAVKRLGEVVSNM